MIHTVRSAGATAEGLVGRSTVFNDMLQQSRGSPPPG